MTNILKNILLSGFKRYNLLLDTYPLITKYTTGTMFSISADLIVQKLI